VRVCLLLVCCGMKCECRKQCGFARLHNVHRQARQKTDKVIAAENTHTAATPHVSRVDNGSQPLRRLPPYTQLETGKPCIIFTRDPAYRNIMQSAITHNEIRYSVDLVPPPSPKTQRGRGLREPYLCR